MASAIPAPNGELALLPERRASPTAPSPSPGAAGDGGDAGKPAAGKAAAARAASPSPASEGGAAAEEPLGWLPATHAAVALRLAELDAALVYTPGQPPGREAMTVFLLLLLATRCLRIGLWLCCTLDAGVAVSLCNNTQCSPA